MNIDNDSSLINQIYFFPKGRTFIEIISIESENEADPAYAPDRLITFRDLQDGHIAVGFFLSEVSYDLVPLPENFPSSKIGEYLKASSIMYDIEANYFI